MALLHGLREWGAQNLVVCHLNHGLRGAASRADARLVERTSAKLGYAFELGEADVTSHAATRRISLESAARELRHAFFQSCAQAHRCRMVFLAHHSDDQVETCLFNFLRGSGAAGLSGMKPRATLSGLTMLRPLLATSRAEIALYVHEQKIAFREDESNESRDYTRNRLRHDLIPAIEISFGPTFRSAVLRAAAIFGEEENWMASQVPKPGETLSCQALRDLPLALRRRMVLAWLKTFLPETGFAETERVLSLLETEKGPAKINLPGNRHARRRAGKIFLEDPTK